MKYRSLRKGQHPRQGDYIDWFNTKTWPDGWYCAMRDYPEHVVGRAKNLRVRRPLKEERNAKRKK